MTFLGGEGSFATAPEPDAAGLSPSIDTMEGVDGSSSRCRFVLLPLPLPDAGVGGSDGGGRDAGVFALVEALAFAAAAAAALAATLEFFTERRRPRTGLFGFPFGDLGACGDEPCAEGVGAFVTGVGCDGGGVGVDTDMDWVFCEDVEGFFISGGAAGRRPGCCCGG